MFNNSSQQLFVISKENLTDLAQILIEETRKAFEKKEDKTLLTKKAACQLLGKDPSTIWRWEKEGYLVPVQTGGRKSYRLSDLNEIKEGRR
ncbi:MAG: MerR family transcriptional regulator [Bacteroidales bacterium]|nr:MerR family transcriptional regulator [Bacteroidales bacterium]MCD8394248.1 MerR family transcriptional regulator [Bacteroidales bacterium]